MRLKRRRLMKMQKLKSKILALIFCPIFLFSCSNGDKASDSDEGFRKVNVAVILPLSEGSLQKKRFTRIADWYLSTLRGAMKSLNGAKFILNLEWYDENSVDLKKTAERLAARNDVFAIVGPLYAKNVQIVAEECFNNKKPVIAPCLSSEEIVHAYSVNPAVKKKKEPFLWSLTETDATQSDALLSKVAAYGGKSVSLISSADLYGRTFFERVPFFASELKLTLRQNVRYTSPNTGTDYETGKASVDLAVGVQTVMESGADYVICALASYKDAETILSARKKMGNTAPKLLFTDSSFSADFLSYGELCEGVEGTSPYADPSSGFAVNYLARYGENPVVAEAQFYDSLLLCGYAAGICLGNNFADSFDNTAVNNAIKKLCAAQMYRQQTWNDMGMRLGFALIRTGNDTGEYFAVAGATGYIDFDNEAYTSQVKSVYSHWTVIDGKFLTVDFTTTDGGDHTGENRAFWTWAAIYDDSQAEASKSASVQYASLKNQWAVIVAASKGWSNYRHQADALYLYRLLKDNGWKDDHIILIMADDIANNMYNSRHRGKVYARLYNDGEENNLYPQKDEDLQIDYLIDEISAENLSHILQGESIALENRAEIKYSTKAPHPHLVDSPTILNTDEHSNVILFWSGHGANNNSIQDGFLVWHGKGKDKNLNFTTSLMQETLTAMKTKNRFRKFLIITETCFSASVLHVAEGIDGVLAFTAANGAETSLADLYSVDIGVWLSNRFSHNFMDMISYEANGKIVYRNTDPLNGEVNSFSRIYQYLVKHTIGSHVCVFNAAHFGNLYETDFGEFFVKVE